MKTVKARHQIDDALGVRPQGQMPNQRMPNLGPVPNQRPMQIPGNPQITPQGMAVSGQQQVGPGMVSGGAMVGPQGFGGGGVNYSAPVAGGQLNVGTSMDPRMKMAQMQAQYNRGPFSVGAQYQPGAGVSGSVGYRQAFAKGGLAEGNSNTMSDEELAQAFSADGNNTAIIAELNRRIKAKLLERFGGDDAAASSFLRNTTDPMAILLGGAAEPQAFAKGGLAMAEGGAWTRKEGQNPEGGLNAKGRASLKAQGKDIKPPVSAKQAKKSPKAAARRKSFCARMSGMPGPMKDDKGRPTRKALSLRKWDCKAEGGAVQAFAEGGQSRVNEAGNYTKPSMRKSLFNSIKAGGSGGAPGQWSARKAQMLAKRYKEKGGGYRD